jgi:hypothetical protein
MHQHFSLPPLTITRDDGRVTISWYPPTGVLEETKTLTDPWAEVRGATNPYTTQIIFQANRFFRIRH